MLNLKYEEVKDTHNYIELDLKNGNVIMGIFTELRVDKTTIPGTLHCYEIRHTDEDDMQPCTIETNVFVNFFGTIITESPLAASREDICDWGFTEM